MKPKSPKYEFPIAGPAWTKGAGHPAGIYYLQGGFHVAALQSPAERQLLEDGALRVASLRFDRDPLEAAHPGRTVRSITALQAARELAAADRN